MHKPLVHDLQRASIYHQGTEASLLELRRFMTLRGLGFPDSPNTTGCPPLVFQGLAPMDQLSKSRTKTIADNLHLEQILEKSADWVRRIAMF